ncbi:hypothetical protein [Parasitella parasitica]|uniref:Tc1-like transposase DDE domain-containing protein n=1 Tax=Parasitella parasitica TaxID=35722 RepID=A0A0B7N3H2_9FUNG|nr:hypothetical protein [Parasitella parasitica]
MEEDPDFFQTDGIENQYQMEDDDEAEFAARNVTLMSYMRTVKASEEAMEIDHSLTDDLQQKDFEEDCEQEQQNKSQSYNNLLQKNKTKKTCRKYTREKVVEFCCLMQEGWPIKAAANKSGIILATAYRYAQYYSQHQEIPDIWKPRGPPKEHILGEVHELFIRKLIDQRGTYTLEYLRETLMQNFPQVVISKTAFYHFIRDNCALSIKKFQLISEYRNSDETKQKRRKALQEWLADKDMDFEKNCVFLDEAGFNLHISRTRRWSRQRKPCKVLKPKSKGRNITILGAISLAGIIDISLRVPEVLGSASKKRSADGKVFKVAAKIGTRTEHFYNYLQNVLDVLNKNNLLGQYIVMDIAPIHKNESIRQLIESKGHKCAYLPPYSPFLNPIEEFWSKVKYHVKRSALDTNDTLTRRITKACQTVTLSDCQGWIRHSISFFQDCLDLAEMM